MKVVFSSKCLEYKNEGHPETPDRVLAICEELKNDKRFEFVEPNKAKDEDLLLVHDRTLIDSVKKNTFFDPDTPNIEDIYEYPLLSVGAAGKAAEIALTE